MVSQLEKSVLATNSTVNRFLYRDKPWYIPKCVHSFLPGPSSSPSSSSVSSTNSSESTLSQSTNQTVSQFVKFVVATSSTPDRFLSHDNRKISKGMVTSLLYPSQQYGTTTKSFLPEEHHTWATSATVSSSSMSAGIDPSRYLLVKTICFLLMYVNHAVNFYLYCLTGKRFRKELAAMLNCGRVTLMCTKNTNDMAAVAGVGVDEIAMHNCRRGVDRPQQYHGRVPPNQAQANSTSSRTRSGCLKRKSEIVDERYS